MWNTGDGLILVIIYILSYTFKRIRNSFQLKIRLSKPIKIGDEDKYTGNFGQHCYSN